MILLRHGQSEFNLHFTATRRDPGIPDPKLTPLGMAQAEEAAEALANEGIRRIIASPYTRAIQTAMPIARRLGIPIHVTPTVRERYAFSCDIGSPRTQLALAFPELDLRHLEEVWWPAVEEPDEQIEARARLFRAEMAALTDWQDTLVVSHWGFILAMTGERAVNGQILRCDPTAPPPEKIVWRLAHHTVVKP
ncbi:histidine phosphatase family protein [Siccirubricoccus sp. KC 17139]|uniref:Histidine phosphatase family protein n=1 Tax=Siccirubricoccus soli TaxID=2899147 RepID=A0ABT1DCK7_9PROT|nr:histidine phosphatase family protein [Siccirubricoccus soli]MCO6419668.1 histidine phosphatase family protein [Siccirubricoccus soli]MCP2685803.1 histidine phosphatase family protein [Siccirubricoccus soli]